MIVTNPLQKTLWMVSVGTLKDGYVHNVPLPRVPRLQSASIGTTSEDAKTYQLTINYLGSCGYCVNVKK
jgi:hypothetical protein